jgi:hypothetical protein
LFFHPGFSTIMFADPFSFKRSSGSSPRKLAAAAATVRNEGQATEILDRLLDHCATVNLISPLFDFIDNLLAVYSVPNQAANV